MQRSTRRRFVTDATVASLGVAGVAVLGPASAGASVLPDFFGRDHVVATLMSVEAGSNSALGQARDGTGAVLFTLMPDADALRGEGQAVSDFSSFEVGEEVFFGGERSGSSMTVTHLRSIFRLVQGVVSAAATGSVSIESEAYSISPHVARRIDPALVVPGTRVSAEVWDDPRQSAPAVIALVPSP